MLFNNSEISLEIALNSAQLKKNNTFIFPIQLHPALIIKKEKKQLNSHNFFIALKDKT